MEKNAPQNVTYYSSISDLCFYVLGSKENLIESNVNVTNKEVMKGDYPMSEGIYDAHMGTTDHQWNCLTCENKKTICPGHSGSLDLRYPVKSPMFRDELLKWLKITCYHCGNIVLQLKKKTKPSKIIGELVKNVRTVTHCIHCKKEHLQIVKDKNNPLTFYRVKELDGKKNMYQEEFFNHKIETVLQRITDETVNNMGKSLESHPSKFVLRTLKVPSNTIRPDLKRLNGPRSSNSDTTNLLSVMVEINNKLPDEIPKPEQIDKDLNHMLLNFDVTYFTAIKGGGGGEIKMVTNINKAPVSISDKFSKKQGRIRKNLMGKRVEYMIRSVITGDSRLKINEIGVPMIHARNLEIPEIVNSKNRNQLNSYFLNKNIKYPGCKRIIKKSDGHTYRIELLDKEYQLQDGDTVLRDMITGDYGSLNRQPSLLFASISGMRVVVMETGETLKMNPAACALFNADFDGDQMNILVPQNIQSRNECMNISNLERWFISSQVPYPFIGAFQDALIGLAELTKDGISFNKWHAMYMFGDISGISLAFNQKTYTNRQIVSMVLPKINVINREPSIYKPSYSQFIKYNPKDISVNIIRGELKSGILDNATTGQKVMGSIFHIIANEYGNHVSLETIYNLQQIVHKFFMAHGFTTGIRDITISETAMKEIKKKIAAMILDSRKITNRLNSGKLIAPLGVSLEDFYENEQTNVLSTGDDFVVPILSDIDVDSNSMIRMILTGSKGKLDNFVSINGAIGNQSINGERFGYQCGLGRTSPYVVRYDTEPSARGFVSTSYREGITSDVFTFTAAEARHGAISNALSTSVSGYLNRISVKNLESIIVDNLRKSCKGMNMIQPLYAECGIDPSKTENVKFITINLSNADFKKNFHTDIKSVDKKFQNKAVSDMLDVEFATLNADREEYRSIGLQMEDHNPKEFVMKDIKQIPVNISRIIEDTIYNYSDMIEKLDPSDRILDPVYIIGAVKTLCAELGYVFTNEYQKKNKRAIPDYIKSSTKFLQMVIRMHLSTAYLLKKNVVNAHIPIIIDKIILTYKKSLIDYGTSVGIIAAQCVCEPMTQYVLNARHRAGQGGTKTDAIVRIQEIIGAKETKSMKKPHMLIMTKREFENDKIKVQEIANSIEMMDFKHFIDSTHIFFEEYGKPVHPNFKHEADIIKEIEKHNYGQKIPGDLAKWCIRFGINKEELISKSMKLETLIIAINKACPDLFTINTPKNSDKIFIRCYIRIVNIKETNNYYDDYLIPLMNKIKNVVVRGVRDIISATVIDVVRNVKNPDGSIEIKKIYGIQGVGSNLREILSHPLIDPYRTQSDSIKDTESIFGITAVRNKIINEMMMTLDGLNHVHCTIFADEMVYSGSVTSIQKTGLQKRENANITLRLSFQTPVQVMQSAAIDGLVDKIGGISGPIIMGTTFNAGTTYNRILVNEEFIRSNVKSLGSVIEEL